MDSQQKNELISAIYQAAAGLVPWQAPLDTIASKLSLWAIQIIGVDKKRGSLLFSFEGGTTLPPEAALDYLRTYHALNPRLGPALALTGQNWMHCHELFDESYVAKDRFYQEFLIPYGGRYLSGTKLMDNEDVLVLLGAMRGNGNPPLAPADIEWLEDVRMHLTQALSMHLHLKHIYGRVAGGTALLDQFRHPMYLVDELRHIHFTNKAARENPVTEEFFTTHGDRFQCTTQKNDADFLVGLRELGLSSPPPGGSKSRIVLRLHSSTRPVDAVAFMIAIRPEVVLNSLGHCPLALVVLNARDQHHDPDPFIIAEAFNLTPAEARIALRVAQGANLESVAHELRISITTVRTHLYSAFSKVGVSRQAELSALLATMSPF